MLEEGKDEKSTPAVQSEGLSASERKIIELQAELKAQETINAKLSEVASNQNQNSGNGFTPEFLEKLMLKTNQQNDTYSKGVGEHGYVDVADIDPKDLIENGHTFFCHQSNYVIVDDTRQNKSVKTPLNTIIVFKYVHTIRKGSGREIDLSLLSSYTSYSKKEVEWLRKSTYYNVLVFDDIKATSSKQARKAAKINQFLNAARGMERASFYSACRSHGIPMNKDPEVMRLALASLYADRAILEEDSSADKVAQNRLKEQALNEAVN